jgi:hypothetical protein
MAYTVSSKNPNFSPSSLSTLARLSTLRGRAPIFFLAILPERENPGDSVNDYNIEYEFEM